MNSSFELEITFKDLSDLVACKNVGCLSITNQAASAGLNRTTLYKWMKDPNTPVPESVENYRKVFSKMVEKRTPKNTEQTETEAKRQLVQDICKWLSKKELITNQQEKALAIYSYDELCDLLLTSAFPHVSVEPTNLDANNTPPGLAYAAQLIFDLFAWDLYNNRVEDVKEDVALDTDSLCDRLDDIVYKLTHPDDPQISWNKRSTTLRSILRACGRVHGNESASRNASALNLLPNLSGEDLLHEAIHSGLLRATFTGLFWNIGELQAHAARYIQIYARFLKEHGTGDTEDSRDFFALSPVDISRLNDTVAYRYLELEFGRAPNLKNTPRTSSSDFQAEVSSTARLLTADDGTFNKAYLPYATHLIMCDEYFYKTEGIIDGKKVRRYDVKPILELLWSKCASSLGSNGNMIDTCQNALRIAPAGGSADYLFASLCNYLRDTVDSMNAVLPLVNISDGENLEMCQLKHQKAKLLLAYARIRLGAEPSDTKTAEAEKKRADLIDETALLQDGEHPLMDGKAALEEGEALLRTCAENNWNLSHNLLGLMGIAPPPFLVKHRQEKSQPILTPADSFRHYYCTAFRCGEKVNSKQFISHALDKCTELLLSGQVDVVPSTAQLQFLSADDIADGENPFAYQPSASALALTKQILTYLKEQHQISKNFKLALTYLLADPKPETVDAAYEDARKQAYELLKNNKDLYSRICFLSLPITPDEAEKAFNGIVADVVNLQTKAENTVDVDLDTTHPYYILQHAAALYDRLTKNCDSLNPMVKNQLNVIMGTAPYTILPAKSFLLQRGTRLVIPGDKDLRKAQITEGWLPKSLEEDDPVMSNRIVGVHLWLETYYKTHFTKTLSNDQLNTNRCDTKNEWLTDISESEYQLCRTR